MAPSYAEIPAQISAWWNGDPIEETYTHMTDAPDHPSPSAHLTELEPLPRAAVRWEERPADDVLVDAIAVSSTIPRALARVLVGRGVGHADDARAYLKPELKHLPEPLRLAGLEAALDRVARALSANETIGVFGDYDVDGVTSTVLLTEFLEQLGAPVHCTIPDRLLEGYGLSKAGVDRLADAGATLIITVDCGVTAHEEILYARSRNLDVIVIDHHTVPVELPKAVAVINPHRADCTRGSEMLCAVGVVFNLVLAIRRHLRERGFFIPSPARSPISKTPSTWSRSARSPTSCPSSARTACSSTTASRRSRWASGSACARC